ncbi:MAG: Short-chain dehydrogenase, associated with 2-hydroxychromene-2-carboxylate isomerase family protein, partial [uncultured Rubrobacteraceae bacterium]
TRGRQVRSAGARPEHGPRVRAAGHTRRPRRHRRPDRHAKAQGDVPGPRGPHHALSRRHRRGLLAALLPAPDRVDTGARPAPGGGELL